MNVDVFNTATSGGIMFKHWYHVVLTYPGGGEQNMRIYVNGVVGTNNNLGSNLPGSIPENATIELARYVNTSNEGFSGRLSNFKLYDVTLTAQEVKTLYDMGRCDEGHHVVNFEKTRLGIGLGDGEAPQGALDMRGGISFNGVGYDTKYMRPGGGLTSPIAINYHIMFNYNRDMSIFYDGDDLSFSWGSGGQYYTRARVGVNGEFGWTFTGQHRNFIRDISFRDVVDKQMGGLIVCANNNEYVKVPFGS
jgi:hypothetical protein